MWGYGRRGPGCWWPRIVPPSGYTYIGHCRCGTGPHAFYQDESGRIVHAWQLWHRVPPSTCSKEALWSELEALKDEKVRLEKRIEELEKQVKEKKE